MDASDFNGSFPYRVDEKGRTKLPAVFAAGLGPEFVATRGLDGCIWLLPPPEWRRFRDQLRSTSFASRSARRLQRFFIGSAVTCSLDSAGRLSLPAVLRDLAGIESEIVIAGVGRWIEVWPRDRWRAEAEDSDATELDELLRAVPTSAGSAV